MNCGNRKEKNTIQYERSYIIWIRKNIQEQLNCGNGEEKNTIHNRCSRDKCDGKSCENVGTDELWEREKNTIRKRRSCEKWDGKSIIGTDELWELESKKKPTNNTT